MRRKRKDKKLVEPKHKRASILLKRLAELGPIPAINPDCIYRPAVWPIFLGVEQSKIREMIESGELKPVKLSEHGRALGLYGSQILEIKAKRIKETAA